MFFFLFLVLPICPNRGRGLLWETLPRAFVGWLKPTPFIHVFFSLIHGVLQVGSSRTDYTDDRGFTVFS